MKTNNLVITDIPKNFSTNKRNILLGHWCQNPFDKKFSTKNLILDHWCNKQKKIKDTEYLINLNERLIKFLTKKLNHIHKKNYSERYWRVLIGPLLYSAVPTIFDRWENTRIFFKKNKKNYSLITFDKINFNKPLTTLDWVELFNRDSIWNHKFYSKIILENYNHRISHINRKFKNEKNKEKFFYNSPHRNKNNLRFFISKIFYKLGILKIQIYFNKYLFDTNIFSRKKFLLLSLKLKNLPFTSSNFFNFLYYNFLEDIKKNSYKEKKLLRKKLVNQKRSFSKNKFENFLMSFLLNNLPKIFVENYSSGLTTINKYITKNKKIIFTQYDIAYNDLYKLWVAEMLNLKSKLVVSEHGAYDPGIVPTNLFHESKISTKTFISHRFIKKKNQITVNPTLPIIYKKIKRNKFTENIIFIHRELPKYNFKLTTWTAITNIFEFIFLKKAIYYLPNHLKTKIKYKCIDKFRNLNDEFSKRYGKNKIIPSNESYEKTIEKAKIIVCLYLSTPTAESFNLNIPTLILLPKNSLIFEKKFIKHYENLKKNKILFDDPKKMSKHISNIWNKVDEWWFSNDIQKAKKKFLKDFFYCEAKSDVENQYTKKLQKF